MLLKFEFDFFFCNMENFQLLSCLQIFSINFGSPYLLAAGNILDTACNASSTSEET